MARRSLTRRNRPRQSRARVLDPNIQVIESLAVDTADTVVNTTVYTSADKTLTTFRVRSMQIAATGGASDALLYFVLRKVPSGYTAPSVTISTSGSVFVDMPNVLAVGFINFKTGLVDNTFEPVWEYIRPQITCFEADTIVLQATTNTTSSGLKVSGLIEFGSRQI